MPLDQKTIQRIRELLQAGYTKKEIAEKLGISRRTLFYYLEQLWEMGDPIVRAYYKPRKKVQKAQKESEELAEEIYSDTLAGRESSDNSTASIQEPTLEPQKIYHVKPEDVIGELKKKMSEITELVRKMAETQSNIRQTFAKFTQDEIQNMIRTLNAYNFVVVPKDEYEKMTEEKAVKLLKEKGYIVIPPYIHVNDLPKYVEEEVQRRLAKMKKEETHEFFEFLRYVVTTIINTVVSMGLGGQYGGLLPLQGYGYYPPNFGKGIGTPGDQGKAQGIGYSHAQPAPNTVLPSRADAGGQAEREAGAVAPASYTRTWGSRGAPKKHAGVSSEAQETG